MSSNNSFFNNRKHLSELYFKSVGEKKVLRKTILNTRYPNEQELIEYTAIDNLVNELRGILGTVVNAVP